MNSFWNEMRLGMKIINPWFRERLNAEIASKLWILRPRNDLEKNNDPWFQKADSVEEFLVRAKSESDARIFAHEMGLDENDTERDPWLHNEYSTCTEIFVEHGGDGVIIRSI